jgi:hypothetical protein
MWHGEDEEECGGGRPRAAGRTEGRQGSGGQDDGGGAQCERAQGGGGTVGQGKEIQKKGLSIRERSRIVP